MIAAPDFVVNRASAEELADHFVRCDTRFIPRLSARVDIPDYAQKIATKAMRFEAWSGTALVGMVAAYCNDRDTLCAYITSVSVLEEWAGQGIALRLLNQCIAHARTIGLRQIGLQVGTDNVRARGLYARAGFMTGNTHEQLIEMTLSLE
jgi:ribosomal protein S18 acetylase RimI-like enzyme